METNKTLVVGLGNPILGDDGVGWRVAEWVKSNLVESALVDVDCLAVGGLTLMEHMVGYSKAILIDAIFTGQNPQGAVTSFQLDELPNRALGHLSSSHDTTLQNALEVGRQMGARLPEQITVIAIESQEVFDFSEQLSKAVSEAVPKAGRLILEHLKQTD